MMRGEFHLVFVLRHVHVNLNGDFEVVVVVVGGDVLFVDFDFDFNLNFVVVVDIFDFVRSSDGIVEDDVVVIFVVDNSFPFLTANLNV